MSIAKARDNLRDARRHIADELEEMPKRILFRGRSKRSKLRRALAYTDKIMAELRGLQ